MSKSKNKSITITVPEELENMFNNNANFNLGQKPRVAKASLTMTKEEAQEYINNSMRLEEVIGRFEWLASYMESRCQEQNRFSGVLIIFAIVMLAIGISIGVWAI